MWFWKAHRNTSTIQITCRMLKWNTLRHKTSRKHPLAQKLISCFHHSRAILSDYTGCVIHSTVCVGVYVSHPELRELVVYVLPHQRQVKQVKSRLLRSCYPGRKEKNRVQSRHVNTNTKKRQLKGNYYSKEKSEPFLGFLSSKLDLLSEQGEVRLMAG